MIVATQTAILLLVIELIFAYKAKILIQIEKLLVAMRMRGAK